MNNKLIILTAQAISVLFSPFYFPVVAFVALFLFSYLNVLPVTYKVLFVAIVWLFTIGIQRLCILLYRKVNGWTRHQIGRRENRYVPYLFSICSYAALLYFMKLLHLPHFTLGIIAGALLIQILGTLLNPWIKMCPHSAAAGGVIGALIAFSLIFMFNPVGWLCLVVLLNGLVGTSRLILRQQTFMEISTGTIVGILCGFFCIAYV